MTAQTIRLPWPPSVNTYWRHGQGRTYISAKGREYRNTVAYLLHFGRRDGYGAQRVSVDILAFPPDKRKRDMDNVLKALLDTLERCKVFDDDSQIDDLRICRMPMDPERDGYVVVTIDTMGGGQDD